MQGAEFGRTKRGWLGHEIFSKQIGVLDHCALKRLENDAAFFQLLGDNVAVDEFIAGENQARGDFIECARLFENRSALIVM